MIAEVFIMVFDMDYNMGHDATVSMIPYGRICYVEVYGAALLADFWSYRAREYLARQTWKN